MPLFLELKHILVYFFTIFWSIKLIKGIIKFTIIPTVHHVYIIRKKIFINKLEGKVKNILKKPPMNNTNIPI